MDVPSLPGGWWYRNLGVEWWSAHPSLPCLFCLFGVDLLLTWPFPKTARYGCGRGVGLSPIGLFSSNTGTGQRIELD